MKGGIAAAAFAALAGSASASLPHHRAAHNLYRKDLGSTCVPGCTTVYTTITGEATLIPNPPPKTEAAVKAETTAPAAPAVPVPTPAEHTCSTTGVYTFPASTVTLTSSTTVLAGKTTNVPAGTHTLGGVTTVVEHPTTVTCPYAKETTSNGVVTSVVDRTVYYCPASGTYTIAPVTKTVQSQSNVVYHVPTTYAPGTYTAPVQVVTATTTDYVYVCPFSSQGVTEAQSKPTEAATKPASKPAAKKPVVKQPIVASQPTYEAPKSSAVKETAPKKTTAASSGSSSSSGSAGGDLQGTGDHYGMTYTPYVGSNGGPKDDSTIQSDIKKIAGMGFQVVRLYSADKLEVIASACKANGLKIIAGITIDAGVTCASTDPKIKAQLDTYASWGQWDLVDLFVVGNEVLPNLCTVDQLVTLITTTKEKFSAYTGPWTVAETLDQWLLKSNSEALCKVIDATGANIHAFFNDQTPAALAGVFVKGQLEILKGVCPGNEVINLECGWPTQGNANGEAIAGQSEQDTAMKSIRKLVGDKTVFFSFENDFWKTEKTCQCEHYWGLSPSCF